MRGYARTNSKQKLDSDKGMIAVGSHIYRPINSPFLIIAFLFVTFNLLFLVLNSFCLESLILYINEWPNLKDSVIKYYWSTVIVTSTLNSVWFGINAFLNLTNNSINHNNYYSKHRCIIICNNPITFSNSTYNILAYHKGIH